MEGFRQPEGVRAGRLVPHLSLAVAGLLVWVSYLAFGGSWLAWTAMAILVAVAAIGVSMFARSWHGRTVEEHTAVVAEASFPMPIVVAHGLLGATTLVLAVLAAAGVG